MSVSGPYHAVRFYQSPQSLSHLVAGFIGEGLTKKQPGVVIATPDHTALVVQDLQSRGFDVIALEKKGRLLLFDAETTLSRFMVDGMPDPSRFEAAIVPVIERTRRVRRDGRLRAYGEMVDVLWKRDQTDAATRLEALWNDLAAAQANPFSLLCGYSMANLYKLTAVDEICSHHSHVVSATGEFRAVN